MKIKDIIRKGLIFSFFAFFLSFSFIFGIPYAISNWFLPIWAVAIIVAVVFVSCIVFGIKMKLNIFIIMTLFLVFLFSSLLFLHAVLNIYSNPNIISVDIWVVYISVCFIVGFLVEFLFEKKLFGN